MMSVDRRSSSLPLVQTAEPSVLGSGSISRSRERYGFLDVLRGVAALAVVIYHVGNRVGAPSLAPHGYLAVDFFFILSGFVIAHSYSERLQQIGFWQFARLRAERLLPLSMLGVAIGVVYILARWHVRPDLSDDLAGIIGAAALNLALIPKFWMGRASSDEMFPENGALWSLSLEMLANLVWALFLVNAANRTLALIIAIGIAMMAWSASQIGDANVGWGLGNYVGGVGRVSFGFLTGVLLWRYRSYVVPRRGGGAVAVVVLLAVLGLPPSPWWVDVVLAVTVLPAVVYLAAGVSRGTEGRFARLLGELSFPLYAVHLPVLMALSGAIKARGGTAGWSVYAIVPLIVVLALAAGRLYDEPIRRRLAEWRTGRASRQSLRKAEQV